MPDGLSLANEAMNVRKSLRVLNISGKPMTDGKSTSNIYQVVSYAKYAWDPRSWEARRQSSKVAQGWLRSGSPKFQYCARKLHSA
jgi:hypothetical protein